MKFRRSIDTPLKQLICVIAMLLLSGCGGLWNASDLQAWVTDQAVKSGCEPESIILDDWYTENEAGNTWKGSCTDASSGEKKNLSISVDDVWTPSE